MNAKCAILVTFSVIIGLVLVVLMWSVGVNNSVRRQELDLEFRLNEIQVQRAAGDVRINGFMSALRASENFTNEVLDRIQQTFTDGRIEVNPDGSLSFLAVGQTFPDVVAMSDLAAEHRQMFSEFSVMYNIEMNRLQSQVTSFNSTLTRYRQMFVTFPNSMFISGVPNPSFTLQEFPILITINHSNPLG